MSEAPTGSGAERVEENAVVVDFNVRAIEDVTLNGPPALMARDWMSPFVWRETEDRWGIMVRAVPRPGDGRPVDTGVIWAGWSSDGGRSFAMLDAPSIVPGPDDHDAGGVEDPTVLRQADGSYIVYYTGVRADMAHGELSYAAGPAVDRLVKSGVVLASSKSEGNTKEATVERTGDGRWRLFYEYAADQASRVGLAIGPEAVGPWDEQPAPFLPAPTAGTIGTCRPAPCCSTTQTCRSCSTTARRWTRAGGSAGSRSTATAPAWSRAGSNR